MRTTHNGCKLQHLSVLFFNLNKFFMWHCGPAILRPNNVLQVKKILNSFKVGHECLWLAIKTLVLSRDNPTITVAPVLRFAQTEVMIGQIDQPLPFEYIEGIDDQATILPYYRKRPFCFTLIRTKTSYSELQNLWMERSIWRPYD